MALDVSMSSQRTSYRTREQTVMIAFDGGDKYTRQSKSSPACKTESNFFSKLGSPEASATDTKEIDVLHQ